MRRLASYALRQFEALDPRHLVALIAAHKSGLDVAEAIARTGSDEALRYLEEGWAAEDPDGSTPTRSALPLMGRRAEPFLLRRLEQCRQGCSGDEAQSILYALGKIGPPPEAARAVIRDVAASASAPTELRREMEDQLIYRGDRAALEIIVRRLRSLRGLEDEDWIAAQLLERIHGHDGAGVAVAGPTLLSYLGRADLRRARLAAIETVWEMEYRGAVPALRAALADADRDWLVAYQALSALAELGGREARPEIARLARDHWYRPVRNSARRALSRLDGGRFELPELGAKDERGRFDGELNFGADLDAARDCRFDRTVGMLRFGRDSPVRNAWPRRGAVRITFEPPSSEALAALGKAAELPPDGAVTLDWPRGAEDHILGVDGGRFDGGLFARDPKGGLRRILAGNLLAAFALGDSLFVFTGDSGRNHEEGDVWRLEAGGPLAVVAGPIRLPAGPTGFALASDRTLLIRTGRGDLALTPKGRLLPPGPCRGPARGN